MLDEDGVERRVGLELDGVDMDDGSTLARGRMVVEGVEVEEGLVGRGCAATWV